MNSHLILIIDDEVQIRKLLTITLHSHKFQVIEAASGKEGIALVSTKVPDLVLLDLGLPDESGHVILKHLREWYTNPIIIISVQTHEEDIIQALDNGANDYLVKPFRTGELLARIRSALRKAGGEPNISVAAFTDLSIDFANRIVKKNNIVVKLTATEYALLSLLARNDGKVLTHQYLLKQIWGSSHQNESQYLRVFIAQLRKKIESDPNRPSYINTESGIGYRFTGNKTLL
ncbi:response regulator [Chryseosolibacter indicus]|uniref:Response regulator transcription factor n=1 Tax=Chryseosolibacter indicus TaxID=2782351 RepID=A0ABS5VSJ8_9BACT|nr:response regulator transcription factor [Chryseosolibacter indicus]MBT1704415.1 response regulator transcription factor [Chryseosolibacter indicus]